MRRLVLVISNGYRDGGYAACVVVVVIQVLAGLAKSHNAVASVLA